MKPLRHGTLYLSTLIALSLAGCPQPGAPGTPGGPGGGGGGGGNPFLPGAPNGEPTVSISMSPGEGAGPGVEVTLDASTASDPDGDELAFVWTQTAGPSVVMSGREEAVMRFTFPFVVEDAALSFRVTVDDGRGGEVSASQELSFAVADAFAGHPQSVEAYRDTLTSDEAYHLLRRLAFGAQPDDVTNLIDRGLSRVVDSMLDVQEDPASLVAIAETYEEDVARRWMVHLLQGPSPLRERMAMFWHDRFATSRRVADGGDRNLGVVHYQMLRRNALGNYRQFLEDLTLDPLMLIWLDGANSPKENPNENYTREFWELFTLGRDVLYTEEDIREGSRAFTGITLLRESGRDPRPIFDIVHHDETFKDIFPERSEPANHNFESVIELTLSQPEAPRYVARNLFVFFVHDHPSDETVQALADFFVENDFEIAPLVRKILLSQAMFSPEARGSQIASPVEHLVGVARTLDIQLFREDSQGFLMDRVRDELQNAGQLLLDPPGVEGWDEGLAWLEDQWVISRVHGLRRLLEMDYGPNHTEGLPYHLLPPVEEWDQREVREKIVNAIAAVFHLNLTEEERAIYVEVLDQNGWLAFHLTDPDRQPRHVFEMIRLMCMDERVIGR